jgi:hypothetical protein
MDFSTRRRAVAIRNQFDQPLRFNPFVFSKIFLLWVAIGVVGGVIAGLYWTVLENLLHVLSYVQGWAVIPLMSGAGLAAGLIIHYLGDPGEMDLIVNNIRFKGGRLEPKSNPAMILSAAVHCQWRQRRPRGAAGAGGWLHRHLDSAKAALPG